MAFFSGMQCILTYPNLDYLNPPVSEPQNNYFQHIHVSLETLYSTFSMYFTYPNKIFPKGVRISEDALYS